MKPPTFHHQARKRFGQNFLVDDNIINLIAATVRPTSHQHLVEVGPGHGAITSLLVAQCQQLDVIEIDRDLVPGLLAQFAKYRHFKLYQADALSFDYRQLVADNDRKLRLVGNLPYNISTPLIFHLLRFRDQVEDMHFMLQKEVVQRLCAGPGEKHYGKLSVMTQYFCEVESLISVPPESFRPVPKVDSAVVRLRPYREVPYCANDVEKLEFLVKQAFQFRRKTLRNCFKNMQSDVPVNELAWNLQLRAEDLSVKDYVELSNQLWL